MESVVRSIKRNHDQLLLEEEDNAVPKFKGVVPQHNGHWGAQIYANHQRMWLGTFKSEVEAAMAYDSAAIKLRNGDSHRNFPWTDANSQESIFQDSYTPESVLIMIRDGSYRPKLEDFLRCTSSGSLHSMNLMTKVLCDRKFSCMLMFQKELTLSDVGKLNRLVIPKRFAIKYFPYACEEGDDDIELVFCDKNMRPWKFRYCYWKSSQSFVFTKGWNRFVKANHLQERDTITFYECDFPEKAQQNNQGFRLIDVSYYGHGNNNNNNNNSGESCVVVEDPNLVSLELKLGHKHNNAIEDDHHQQLKANEGFIVEKKKGFRLFGVQIDS